jgi:hypothetical protein
MEVVTASPGEFLTILRADRKNAAAIVKASGAQVE